MSNNTPAHSAIVEEYTTCRTSRGSSLHSVIIATTLPLIVVVRAISTLGIGIGIVGVISSLLLLVVVSTLLLLVVVSTLLLLVVVSTLLLLVIVSTLLVIATVLVIILTRSRRLICGWCRAGRGCSRVGGGGRGVGTISTVQLEWVIALANGEVHAVIQSPVLCIGQEDGLRWYCISEPRLILKCPK